MTKDEFNSKQKAVGRYFLKMSLLWGFGFGLFALLRLFVLPAKKNIDEADPVSIAFLAIYGIFGLSFCVWLTMRRERQLGFLCPNCGKRFSKLNAKSVITAGKCMYCGEIVIEELKTQP